MKMLVRGKWVLAGSGKERRIIKDGAVYIEDTLISDIGKYEELRKHYYDVGLGSEKHIVMPGLINSHHHGKGVSHQMRGVMDTPWELRFVYYLKHKTDVDPYYDSLYACIKHIESGVTCAVDHHHGVDPIDFSAYKKDLEVSIKAFIDSGMRVAFCPALENQNLFLQGGGLPGDEERLMSELLKEERDYFGTTWFGTAEKDRSERVDLYFKAFDEVFTKYDNYDGRVRIQLGPTGVERCTDDLLERIQKVAQRRRTRIHIHVLETRYQKKYGYLRWGKSVVEHLADIGCLGPEVTCAHCVNLTNKDIDIFAQTKTNVATNPSSNLRLFDGIAPVLRMKEKGVNVALGTDGNGINDDDDLFQEMRMLSLLHRAPGIKDWERRRLTPDEVLDMATVNGAKATGFSDIGSLEIGKKADLILVNTERILSPYVNLKTMTIPYLIVSRTKGLDVDIVIINGEVIMENKRFIKLDKAKVLYEVKKSMEESDRKGMLEPDPILEKINAHIKSFYEKWEDPWLYQHIYHYIY